MSGRRAALLGALLISAGCGQKGALYLPDPAPQAVPAPPARATPDAPATPAAPTDDEATRRKTPTTPDPASAR
ncbi:MAG TPA: lipoprotein [Steroidobacteraceae bacterium]|nr:lipoprotein [Steroidobacteraceae bacterium]